MNRVEELIQQLCPNGVEWKKLGEVCKIMNGKDYKHLSKGKVPVYGSGGVMTYVDTFVYDKPSVLLPRKGSLNNVFYVDTPFWTVDTAYWTKIDVNILLEKFFYYFVTTQNLAKKNIAAGAVPSLTQEILNKIEIPIPPLPIQQEIVRILDTFIELQKELTANLQTELDARKKQYAYYRDCLLNFEGVDGVEWKKLGEVCEIKGRIGFRGYTQKDLVKEEEGAITLSPSNIINECLDFSNCSYISWFKYNESPEIQAEIGDVLFTKTASVGKCALIKYLPKSATINPQLVLLKKITCNAAYLTYVLLGNKFQDEVKKVTGIGSVPNIPQSSLSQIRIPIPPLPEQRRIVAILDHFETLVNDLSVGLPAELEARRKQYEYYRDKLLTFDRV